MNRKRRAEMINRGKIQYFNEECWNPGKSSFEANQENTFKRLKLATGHLLETNFQNLNQLPAALSDGYDVTVHGCNAQFYEMFEEEVRSDAKNNLLPKLKRE